MTDINKMMDNLTTFLTKCDERLFISVDEIMSTGLFESIEEVNVFFVTFNEHDYITYVNAQKYFGNLPKVQNNTTDLF